MLDLGIVNFRGCVFHIVENFASDPFFIAPMDKYEVLLVLLATAFWCSCASSERPLYFSLMVPSAASINTTGIVYAVNNTLVTINNSSTLLTSNKLLYINEELLDAQVCLHIYHICAFNSLVCLYDPQFIINNVGEGERGKTLMKRI